MFSDTLMELMVNQLTLEVVDDALELIAVCQFSQKQRGLIFRILWLFGN